MHSPLSYVGGKHRLSKLIVSHFPEHKTYVELFSGGAQVLFRKPPSDVEVLNDCDRDVTTFFRVCQLHSKELMRYMDFMINSREWFEQLEKTPAEILTDIQRAARFLYLQKLAYGGRVFRRSYASHVTKSPNYRLSRVPEIIKAIRDRVADVQVECLPYEQVIEKYDRPTTLFYIDPPYFEVPRFYNFNFEQKDFEALEQRLRTMQGKFILSINDRPFIRELFREYRLTSVDIAYGISSAPSRMHKELLIKNFS